MINVSNQALSVIEGFSRTFLSRFLLDGTEVSGDIRSVQVYKGSSGESQFVPGSIYASHMDAVLYGVTEKLEGKELEYQIGTVIDADTVEWYTIGFFTVYKPSTDAYQTTFEALGRISAKMGGAYTTNLEFPATIQAVLDEISESTGVPIVVEDGLNTDGLIETKPTGYLHREMLAFIAGIFFGYATEDSQGQVKICKYSTENRISTDGDRTVSLPTFNDLDTVITGVKVIIQEGDSYSDEPVDEVSFTSGVVSVTVANPFMTQALFDENAGNLVGLIYSSGKVPISMGDFRIEPFDCLEVTDVKGTVRTVPCMYVKHTYDGGVQTEIIAPGLENESGSSTAYRGALGRTVEKMKVQLLYAEQILAKTVTTEYLEANYLKATQAELKYATITQLDATNAQIEQLSAKVITTDNLSAEVGKFGYATVTQLNAVDAKIDTLLSKAITTDNLEAKVADLGYLTVDEAVAKYATIDSLNSTNATIQSLSSIAITTDNLSAKVATLGYLKASNLEAEVAEFGYLKTADLEASVAEFGYLKTADAKITYATITSLDATNANVTNLTSDLATFKTTTTEKLEAQDASIESLTAKDASIEKLLADKASVGELEAVSGRVGDLESTTLKTADLSAEVAKLGYATVTDLNAATARITTLESSTVKASELESKVATFGYLKTETAEATYATLENLKSTNANITNLQTAVADIEKAYMDEAEVNNLIVGKGYLTEAQVETLVADKGYITTVATKELLADYATVASLNTTNANVSSLQSKVATIESAYVNKATVNQLIAEKGYLTEAEIDELVVDKGYITTLETNNLLADYATIDLANVKDGSITSAMIGDGVVGTAQIADGSITDAKIVGLTANKITAGKLDAGVIEVVNLNAANITVGTINGTQIAAGAISSSNLASSLNNTINTASSNASTALADAAAAQSTADTAKANAATAQTAADKAQETADSAVSAASTAQTTADGKNTVFYQTSTPSTSGRKTNDVWFDTDDGNKMYYWNGSVWTAKQFSTSAIAANAITAGLIASSAITTAKIAADAITAEQIATGAVTADAISAGSVTTAKIATSAITAELVASGAITSDKIVSSAITADKIAANAVTANKILAGAVTADKIASGAITTAKLASGAVTADKILAGTITADRIDIDDLFAQDITATGKISGGWIDGGTISGSRIYSRESTYDSSGQLSESQSIEINDYSLTQSHITQTEDLTSYFQAGHVSIYMDNSENELACAVSLTASGLGMSRVDDYSTGTYINKVSISSSGNAWFAGDVCVGENREKLAIGGRGVYYIEGTGSTAGTWLGSHDDITEYYDGLTIVYKVGIAGVSGGTTLNINSLGAVAVMRNASSKVTTHYGVNSVVMLTYTTDDGTGYWKTADYDANNYAYVRQYYTTTSANYPLLAKYDSGISTTTSYVTKYTRYSNSFYINPSAGTLTAPTFVGVLTGNADTATKLATARTINGVSFDGSANITVADSTKLPLAGGQMTGPISFSGAAALPSKTLSYIVGIDAFASGGQMGWQSKADFLAGYLTSATAASTYALASHTHSYLPLSGGTLTGNLSGEYITGTWLQATASNHSSSAGTKFVIQDSSGWLYHRTAPEVLSDIGAAAASHSHSYLPLSGGSLTGAVNSTGNITITNSNPYVKFVDSANSNATSYFQAYQGKMGMGFSWAKSMVMDQSGNMSVPGAISEKGFELSRIYCSMIPYGTAITANSDLNTVAFMKVGNYYCSANATVATLTNCPTSSAFMMQVYSPLSTTIDNESTKTWIYRLRKMLVYTGEEYVQYCYVGSTAGTWTYGAWKKVIKSDDTAAAATKLATARTIQTNLGSTSSASFNGTANITPGVTGTLAIGNGGTGATTAAAALVALGALGKASVQQVSQTINFTSSTSLTQIGTVTIPANCIFFLNVAVCYQGSKPSYMRLKNNTAGVWLADSAVGGSHATGCCGGHVGVASTIGIYAQYASAATNVAYVYGWYISIA